MKHINSAVRILDLTASKYGNRIAIETEIEEITYSELQLKSKKIGTGLIMSNTSDNLTPVIVFLEKGIPVVECFMAALYSGNPYVPIAYDMPLERIKKIIDGFDYANIITDENGFKKLKSLNISNKIKIHLYAELLMNKINNKLIEEKVNNIIDTDPIYIMFTSGSTGIPKGVTISHRGVIDFANWLRETFDLTENSIIGNQAQLYFDLSVSDIYGSLISGAKLVIIPTKLFYFPSMIPDFLNDYKIDTIFFVPTVLINIANSGILENIDLKYLKNVIFCGEVMPNSKLNIWRKYHPQCRYVNTYGPTEITVMCTYYIIEKKFDDNEILPIGTACQNTRVIILNEENKQAKQNEVGEICVLGSGVYLGYWNNDELNNNVLIQNPLNKNYRENLYRTGDIGYIDDDGNIIFVGRADDQIKYKGNRIELGEIERAAMCIDGVERATVLFDNEKTKLILFIKSDSKIKLQEIKNKLKIYIPKYMIPSDILQINEVPYTKNGKVDKKKLRIIYEKNREE